MIKMKSRGASKAAINMRNTADLVIRNAREMMKRSADRIVVEARLNAPVDEERLEESIHIEKTYEGSRGRLSIEVVAGGIIDGIDVSEYATIIHENYESYQPGEGTVQKRLRNPGRYVGGKFLDRAAEKERQKLANLSINLTRKIL